MQIGTGKRPPVRTAEGAARVQRMAEMYRSGMTSNEIAAHYGLSSNRVLVLLRTAGVEASDGGAAVRAAARRQRAEAERDARCVRQHGCTYAQLLQLRTLGAVARYAAQKKKAALRGIPFRMTLGEWWSVWLASGKWGDRGRGAGRYCMARHGDAGAYELGNVSIQSNSINSRDGLHRRTEPKQRCGVFCIYPGTTKPWAAQFMGKRLGCYATEQEAYEARKEAIKRAGQRIGVSGGNLGSGLGYTRVKRCVSRPFFMQGPGGANGWFATADEARAAYLHACRAYAATLGIQLDQDSAVHRELNVAQASTQGNPYPASPAGVLAKNTGAA